VVEVNGDARAVIRQVSLAWEDRLRGLFDDAFRKYVRVLHGAPTRERIGGKLPLVAVYLFDIHLTEHARVGKPWELRAMTGAMRGLRLDYQFTAWTEEPLDEQLLLDRIRNDLDMNRSLDVAIPDDREPLRLGVSPKPSLKFENIVSFWNSMGWPPKVSLQYSVKSP
jgi:hypothetical protein